MSDGVEFEIEFARDGVDRELDQYHVHVPCFTAWEFELQNLGGQHDRGAASCPATAPPDQAGTLP